MKPGRHGEWQHDYPRTVTERQVRLDSQRARSMRPAPIHPDVAPGQLVLPRRHLWGFAAVLLVLVLVLQAWGLLVPLGALALVLRRL